MLAALRQNRNLAIGCILTLFSAILLIGYSFIEGRNQLFLDLNGNLGIVADYFFRFWTNMGDGLVWVAVAILFFARYKKYFPLLIAAVAISTLVTQVTKDFLVPAEPRPTAVIKDLGQIHMVPGVELHTAYSFPSGHTGTAFTIFLMGCLLVRRKWILPVGFAYAVLVGYSRVYLAQHFPLDVGAGMITGLITIWVSILVQQKWEAKKRARPQP